MDDKKIFVSYDADSAGRLIGQAILADDPDSLRDASDKIILGNDLITKWAERWHGASYSSGGDQGLFLVPEEAVNDLDALKEDYHFITGLTVTMGVGRTLSESGKALLVGKFRGKNMIVRYDDSIENEISQAKDRVSQGLGSAEEQKLSEAYLEPQGEVAMKSELEEENCPYCADTAEEEPCPYCDEPSEDDACPYCQDSDHEACPYCAEAEGEEGAEEGKERTDHDDHIVDQTAGATVHEPTTQSGEDYEGVALPTPVQDKPIPEDQPEQGLASQSITSIDDQHDTNSNVALQPGAQDRQSGGYAVGLPTERQSNGRAAGFPEDEREVLPGDNFEETPHEIVDQLDADQGNGPTPEDEAAVAQMDDADLGIGENSEENVSRPEDYEENIPGDMGLGEEDESDEPDYGGLMQEDLDAHADGIQREKVVQMVSEALEGFKGCRDILEKAKDRAPQLYQSSLAMLRAMIEMAKMMDLGGQDETAEEVVGEEAPQEEMPAEEASPEEGGDDAHDWEEPFPQHPDHGPEAPEEDAIDPKPPGR